MSKGTLPQVARTLKDGSMKMLCRPERIKAGAWHVPKLHVASRQWRPETRINRYEWARQQTPEKQLPFWEHVRQQYAENPPQCTPEELLREMWQKGAQDCGNGLPGVSPEYVEALAQFTLRFYSPDNKWSFYIACEPSRFGGLQDNLGVSHMDRRTLPDWPLLMRLRAWALPDDRETFMWLPGFQGGELHTGYENAKPNNLQFISPRPLLEEVS